MAIDVEAGNPLEVAPLRLEGNGGGILGFDRHIRSTDPPPLLPVGGGGDHPNILAGEDLLGQLPGAGSSVYCSLVGS